MFPGFVNAYKDIEGCVHLFFYPGIDDNGNVIYNNLDMSNCKTKYEYITYKDNSVEYIFNKTEKPIRKIICKLVEANTKKIIEKTIKIC